MLNSFVDNVLHSLLSSKTQVKERVEKGNSEIDLKIQKKKKIKMLKILYVNGIIEKRILKFLETNSFLSDCCFSFIYPYKAFQLDKNGEYMIIERKQYFKDLEEIIQSKSFSNDDICSAICSICKILAILSEYGLVVGNLKSSNVVYEDNNDIKLCDLCLNEVRKGQEMMMYDICFKSPEELNGLECNEKSVNWSIGCILYEIINKKLPFNEDNNTIKTLSNIMKCEYNRELIKDDMIKEIMERILCVKNEDRLSLKELRKEMNEMSEIFRDEENSIIMSDQRKEMLYNYSNNIFSTFPIIYPLEHYLESEKLKEIGDDLVELYNKQSNTRILSILLMMKLYKEYVLKIEKLRFQIHHKCKEEECHLDKIICNIGRCYPDKEIIKIESNCCCLCEEGMYYLFKILKLINPKKLKFDIDWFNIQLHYHSLFGTYFIQFSNLEVLDLSECHLTHYFMETFVKTIPYMKLKSLILWSNPIGPKGFKLLLPYLHLLINDIRDLDLLQMNLNDESMILLSQELHKYKYTISYLVIMFNPQIHLKGLKEIFSVYPASETLFRINGCKELLIDKTIPKMVESIIGGVLFSILDLSNSGIDDDILKQFLALRSDELQRIGELNLSNNKLTYRSIEVLIYSINNFPKLMVKLYGNEIGDEGMKILSPHLCKLKDCVSIINCSNMGLSSTGLKYILDGVKKTKSWIRIIYLNGNNIDSDGVEYMMNSMKDIKNVRDIYIHNNPIGNDGFKSLLGNLELFRNFGELNLSNTSIDDESVLLLINQVKPMSLDDHFDNYLRIFLGGNHIGIKAIKSVYSKSLEEEGNYPFIEMKCSLWTNEELECYLNYCIKATRHEYRKYDFSNLNINDSHIRLIKQIYYERLDLFNNKISYKGLKELIDSLPEHAQYISIYNNEIGDEGIEIICENLDTFILDNSLIISNVGMSEKGLNMLIERLKDYQQLKKINIEGYELNERELRMMRENEDIFYKLDVLAITIKDNFNKSELKSFFETYSSINYIFIDGITEEEKKELSEHFYNVK